MTTEMRDLINLFEHDHTPSTSPDTMMGLGFLAKLDSLLETMKDKPEYYKPFQQKGPGSDEIPPSKEDQDAARQAAQDRVAAKRAARAKAQ